MLTLIRHCPIWVSECIMHLGNSPTLMGDSKNSSQTYHCWWVKWQSISIHATEQLTIASAAGCCHMVGMDRIPLGVCCPLLIHTLSKPVAICLNPLHDPCMGKINPALQECLTSHLIPPQLEPWPGSAARVTTTMSHTTFSLRPNTPIVTDIQHYRQPLVATTQNKTGLCIHNMYMTIHSTWCCHSIAFLCTMQYVSTSMVQ
jgi:hypothetical protein